MIVKDENGVYLDLEQNTRFEWNERAGFYIASSIGKRVDMEEFEKKVLKSFIYEEENINENIGHENM